ncbi:serine/threonine-protein phosphatase [Xenorhabdus bovienii]|uniref:PP2C family protein-serine/threonine phosphatase n=1 Tax=Xenorhabdus bovienii TaxID=40576 RepID=UPI00237C9285|nr:PP2C family serine/threonine-protein phosphatase [Xenorhabdus bovienii]MDE1476492.1 serine/threonine-protein phosphatase [Xenorhabdus bovienii]MDE9443625.1 serine/threonine-protein phosphatase [Xenorhabdus bovienii]
MINLVTSAIFSFSNDIAVDNQDAILSPRKLANGYIFAVADGVGSYEGAREAANLTISYLETLSINKHFDIGNIFEGINKEIRNLPLINSSFHKAATTLTFCFINEDGIWIGHIGDCRLYIQKENKLKQITKDHTRHQQLIDEKIFTAKELKGQPGKNILTTAISPSIPMDYASIFIPREEFSIDDNYIKIFIMSDGAHHFWEKRPRFSDNTLRNPIRFASSLQKRIEKATPIDDYSLVAASFKIS